MTKKRFITEVEYITEDGEVLAKSELYKYYNIKTHERYQSTNDWIIKRFVKVMKSRNQLELDI